MAGKKRRSSQGDEEDNDNDDETQQRQPSNKKREIVNNNTSQGPGVTAGAGAGVIEVHELYKQCIQEEDDSQRLDNIREWEERGALAELIWPFLTNNCNNENGNNNNNSNNGGNSFNEFIHGCHLLVLFVAYHFRDGCFGSSGGGGGGTSGGGGGGGGVLSFMTDKTVIEKILQVLFYKMDHKDFALQTNIVTFIIGGLSNSDSNNKILLQTLLDHLTGIKIMHWVPERRRELEFKKSAGLRRRFADSISQQGEQQKVPPMWSVSNAQQILHLLEGHSEYGALVNIQKKTAGNGGGNGDVEEMTMDVPLDVWNFIHRSLELWIDLLSMSKSRVFLVKYLDSIHFSVRCRLAVGNNFAVPENLRLLQHLLQRINTLLSFPIEDGTHNHLSKVDVVSMHHARATILQKMAYRHYPRDLQQVIYAGLGLLCGRHHKNSYLERSFVGFPDDELLKLLYRMRLINEDDKTLTRQFMLEVLANNLRIPPYPTDQLKAYPLYPTEKLLWDHNIIPPSSVQLRATQVLALPKLNPQFLSFHDYLSRNFELVRLESAYEIRSDIVNVLKRVRPILGQSNLDESEEIHVRTEFSGWSRMALELAQPMKILEVQPPKLGETVSQRIMAEIEVDLGPYAESIRREWDEIGDCDNLFLVAVDASKMSGNPAPLLKDYHLKHGLHRMWDSDKGNRVPDDEDSTFPSRFGITAVRGCMVYRVRNEHGTLLSEPGVQLSDKDRKSTKRIFSVMLDTAQYAKDLRSTEGTDIYRTFNLVIRRHGRENNFKSVLETIRGLLEGAGSIERVIPPWLRPIILGYGEPSAVHYQSENMKTFAMNTVGVNKPTDYLDFGDTFLNESHLRDSFNGIVTVDGRETIQSTDESMVPRCNFRIRFSEDSSENGEKVFRADAVSVPFPSGVTGNPIRFTPVQVEAVRSGLSPGLTLVVGPPGTGKTDVAVQIITSLYHSFPTQRTIIITHSNAALNDIFSKVMARGDVDERYLVRLGSGERDLDVDSSHDFTKIGRVSYSISRRGELLDKVQWLSESLGVSDKSERGADGSSSYTCETAEYFKKHHVDRKMKQYEAAIADKPDTPELDVTDVFPFSKYFQTEKVTNTEAKRMLKKVNAIFEELREYRPFELLRTQRQRSDYLITKQARIVAMTCTHAAIARSNLLEIGFEYDNVVMEEAGQMLEIETFIPLLLQKGKSDDSVAGLSRLKRICMLGDHNQLPPVVKNASFSRFSNLDQSQFTRLIRLGVPYVQLDKQGRTRPELRKLYSWRYENLGDLNHVVESEEYRLANPGFAHTFQLIDVDDFQGRGESTPTPYFYQNLGEAEYAVALFQYMVLIGYAPERVSILTTYNGQKELITDIVSQRCGDGTPLAGIRPKAISTVDQYQGQQNDIIILSLVRTKTVGHLRDIRRLVVAVSRARLGLYVLCRKDRFMQCHELKNTMSQFKKRPNKLQLVLGETCPTDRKVQDSVPSEKLFEVEDVSHLGSIVHSMQENMVTEEEEQQQEQMD